MLAAATKVKKNDRLLLISFYQVIFLRLTDGETIVSWSPNVHNQIQHILWKEQ